MVQLVRPVVAREDVVQLVHELLLAVPEIDPLRDAEQVDLRVGVVVVGRKVGGKLVAAREIAVLPPLLRGPLAEVGARAEKRDDGTALQQEPRDVAAMLV